MSLLVSSVDNTELRSMLGDLKADLETGVGDQRQCSGEQLAKTLKTINASIQTKMFGHVKNVEEKKTFNMNNYSIKADDYSTIEELWAACMQEGDSKLAEGTSEDKTVDILEMSDEGSCRSKTRSFLSFMFESWQMTRDGYSATIEKRSVKSSTSEQEAEMKKQITLLYWGKEVHKTLTAERNHAQQNDSE